jgi:hypothetical protein
MPLHWALQCCSYRFLRWSSLSLQSDLLHSQHDLKELQHSIKIHLLWSPRVLYCWDFLSHDFGFPSCVQYEYFYGHFLLVHESFAVEFSWCFMSCTVEPV